MTIQLRPDQFKLKSDVYDGWNSGMKTMMAVLATGGGKSVIMSDIVLDGAQQGAWQVVCAHRNELVTQMSVHIGRRGIPHRVIGSAETVREATAQHREEFSGKSFVSPNANTAVASVQTILARAEQLKKWASNVHRFFGDEGHHYLRDNMFGEAWKLFNNAQSLLVTATPSRADGKGLGTTYDGIVDRMVCGIAMRELIDIGALSDYEIAIPDSDFEIDDKDFNKDGELSPKKGREASKRSHIVGDVVKEYSQRALGRKFICFATDVETANEMAQSFNAAGIPCASVSAKTPTATRNEYIRRFKRGQLIGLINVDLFGEGFDVPSVEVVIMARPTGSLAVYLQQFGRALRVMAGKKYGLVIDHVSNWKRHGFPDKKHIWTLERREKRAKKDPDPEMEDLVGCKNCSRPYPAVLPACKWCDAEPPAPDPVNRKPQNVDGNLLLLTREMIAQMQAATELESPASMAERVEAVAGPLAGRGAFNRQTEKIHAQQRLQAAIAQWAGWQRHLGRSDAESYRRFYLTTGVDVISIQALDDRAKYESMAEMVEGWNAKYAAEVIGG